MVLPKVWHSGMKIRVEWQDSDFVQTYPEILVKELEIPRYEKPADLYVVFYPEHEVEVVVSVAEPGHPEWAGRIKQSPWNQCVADFGRKVCKRAIPKPGLDIEELRGLCTYFHNEKLEDADKLCEQTIRECIHNYEDEDLCKSAAWDKVKK